MEKTPILIPSGASFRVSPEHAREPIGYNYLQEIYDRDGVYLLAVTIGMPPPVDHWLVYESPASRKRDGIDEVTIRMVSGKNLPAGTVRVSQSFIDYLALRYNLFNMTKYNNATEAEKEGILNQMTEIWGVLSEVEKDLIKKQNSWRFAELIKKPS